MKQDININMCGVDITKDKALFLIMKMEKGKLNYIKSKKFELEDDTDQKNIKTFFSKMFRKPSPFMAGI